MKNKYYTPSIEEFYVGFEYESHQDPRTDDGWEKSILGRHDFKYVMREDNDVDYRVKYLDKSDIEDLGFKLAGGKLIRDYRDSFEYHPDKHIHYVLDYTYSINKVRILKEDSNYFHEDEIVLFEGIIKNKSELKILLKQLNIK
jgi:hypothetical protein